MKIILTAVNQDLFEAWKKHCQFDFVEVYKGSFFDTECDAVVCLTNGFGFLSDDIVTGKFGDVEPRLQRIIKEDYDGELLVGQAVLIPTYYPSIPYMIAAPTMRVPVMLPPDSVNAYLAAKAAILCALRSNEVLRQYSGDPKARKIETLSFPGIGTGVDNPEICAHQVAAAINETLINKHVFPRSRQDALHRHRQLWEL